MRFSVKAPATSANIGPGFDTIGIAVDMWNTATIDTETSEDNVTNTGTEAPLLHGRENLTQSAMRMLAHDFRKTLPPVSITADTLIPVSRGLGSSAAALTMGLVATNLLLDLGLSDDDIFERAWAIEGHGDNVGAAIYGGAVMAVPSVRGITRLCDTTGLGLTCILFIPDVTGATHAARAALPATVPHKDATGNVQAVSALTVGLVRHDHTLIAAGMHDLLHEPYRAPLFPHLTPLQEVARTAGAVGAVLSGAGPTVLTLVQPDLAANVATAMERAARDVNTPGRVIEVALSPNGYQVNELVGS